MIKMKSRHPLLVGGEARTEFETDEQHARELELSGLAARVLDDETSHPGGGAVGSTEPVLPAVNSSDALESVAPPAAAPQPAPEPTVPAAAAAKPKRAK